MFTSFSFVHFDSFVAIVTLLPSLVQSQSFQYITNSSLPSTNLPDGCANALMSNISCNPWVSRFRPGQYYDPNGLQVVCTSGCQNALQNYQSSLAQSCSGQTYNYTNTTYLPISAIASRLQYNYQLVCMQDSGRFCNNIAYQASVQSDSDAQQYLGPPSNTTISSCDKCFIKQLQLEAGSPFDGGPDLASEYTSLTKSCSISNMPITTTTISSSMVSAPAPTTTCAGSTYRVSSSDTCRSIAKAQGISVGWLVYDNPTILNAYCANFTASGSLCIQDNCDTYTVQQNDNCTSIAKANNVTQAQLLSWNPVLNPTCSNIGLSVNDTICISKPGTPYSSPTTTLPVVTYYTTAAPVPTDVAANTTHNCGLYYEVQGGDYCNQLCLKFGISLEDLIFLNPALNENCTNLFAQESYCVEPVGNFDDYPGHSGYIPPTSAIASSAYTSFPTATFTMPEINVSTPLPVANQTRNDCYLYVDGDNLQASVAGTFYSSVCQLYADTYQVTLDMLQNWNPSLVTNSSSCTFDSSLSYCMSAYNSSEVAIPVDEPQTALPLRDGTLTNCTAYTDADGNVNCATILSWYNLTIAQFYAWNPAVGNDCRGLWLGYSYCVSMSNTTAPSNDTSTVSNTITATPTTGTQTGSMLPPTATPPAPTQSGQPANCNEWYVPQSGDTCATVEKAYLLSDEQFKEWNPAVSADCSQGFWAGEAYCVGTTDFNPPPRSSTADPTSAVPTTTTMAPAPGPTQPNSIISSCNKYAAAQSGDYCSKFASDNGITTAQLYAWNSVLGANGENCNNAFWANEYYCVGISSS